jgi:hypothetical protein
VISQLSGTRNAIVSQKKRAQTYGSLVVTRLVYPILVSARLYILVLEIQQKCTGAVMAHAGKVPMNVEPSQSLNSNVQEHKVKCAQPVCV